MHAVALLPDIAFQREIFCLMFSVWCFKKLVRDISCYVLASLAVVIFGFISMNQDSFNTVCVLWKCNGKLKPSFSLWHCQMFNGSRLYYCL